MKKMFLLVLFLVGIMQMRAISLEQMQEKARQNYPLIKQFNLLEKTADFNLKNVTHLWLPQVNLNVKATYQSDVTQIPASLGNILSVLTGNPVSFPSLTNDQYQAQAEITQLIYDGGVSKVNKQMILQGSKIEKEQLEIQFHKLKERIHGLFFGTMLVKEQISQTQLMESELKNYQGRLLSLRENGIAESSQLDQMSIEIYQLQQKLEELQTIKANFEQLLTAFAGEPVSADSLEKPVMPENTEFKNLREELRLMEAQLKLTDIQKSAINTSLQPKLGMFLNAGAGRPGLNMFTNEFSPYFMGGIRLSWNLSSLYNRSNDLKKVDVQIDQILVQQENFLFEQKLMSDQQKNEINKLKRMLERDKEIVRLHDNIVQAENARLQNGILSITDLIRESNAREIARQQQIVHEIQLLSAANQLKLNYNN